MLPLSQLKAVIFDLDDTLVDRGAAFERYCRDFYVRQPALSRHESLDSALTKLVGWDRRGYAARPELFSRMVDEWFAGTLQDGAPLLTTADLDADFAERFPACFQLTEPIVSLLVGLRSRGVKLGVVTNGGAARQAAKIAACGLEPLVDCVLISEAFGYAKPDAVIFIEACRRLDCRPAEAVFVGDNPQLDVAGARAAGMTAVWLAGTDEWPAELASPEHQISAVAELASLLEIS